MMHFMSFVFDFIKTNTEFVYNPNNKKCAL